MDGELIIIFRTPSEIEANVIRGLLETHGIACAVLSDNSRTAFPLALNDQAWERRVAVHPEEAAAAVRIIDSHRDVVEGGRVVPFGSELEPLERRIGYRFKDLGMLEHALTHRSRVHEDASGGVFDNESMEFLGDSVLGFVIAAMLFREFPQHNEGQKSKLKASLVSAAALARLGEHLSLGDFLILGRGEEKTGGRHKHAIIADCYEALIAAIYLDGQGVRVAHRGSQAQRRGGELHGRLEVRAAGVPAVGRPRPAGVPPRRRSRPRSPQELRRRSGGGRRGDREGGGTEQEGGGPGRRPGRARAVVGVNQKC